MNDVTSQVKKMSTPSIVFIITELLNGQQSSEEAQSTEYQIVEDISQNELPSVAEQNEENCDTNCGILCDALTEEQVESQIEVFTKRKNGKRCSGYNIFFQDLIKTRAKTKESFGEIAKLASKEWKRLPPSNKAAYHLKGQQHCLELSMKLPLNEEKYKCSKCGRKVGLHKNLLTHEKECGRTFPCSECDAKFGESRNLRMHIRSVHEKIKLFKCKNCIQRFSYKKDLERHQVVHTGSKPYKCNICNKTFSWNSNLKRHKVKAGHFAG